MIKDLATAMHRLPHHRQAAPADSPHVMEGTGATQSRPRAWYRRPGIWLAVVLALALAIRMTLLVAGPLGQIGRAMDGESVRMLELADNLAATGSFGRVEQTGTIPAGVAAMQAERGALPSANRHGLIPEVYTTPVYPAFVSLFIAAGVPLWGVLVVQCLLSTAGVYLVYQIGWRLIGSAWVGLIGAAVLALHPADMLYASTISGTALLSFVLLAGLFLFSLGRAGRPGISVGGGLIIGLAALIHPVTLWFGPLLGLAHLLARRTSRSLGLGLLIAGVSLLPAAGWAARNLAVGGGLRLSSAGPVDSYFHTGGQMKIAIAQGDPQADWPAAINSQFSELQRAMHPDETVFAAMRRLMFARIIERPDIYGMLRADTVIRLFTDHSVNRLYQLLGREHHASGLRGNLLRGDLSSMTITRPGQLLLKICWTTLNLALAVLMIQGLYRAWREGCHTLFWVTALWFGLLVVSVNIHSTEQWRVALMGLGALAVAGTFSPLFASPEAEDDARPLAVIGPVAEASANRRRAA